MYIIHNIKKNRNFDIEIKMKKINFNPIRIHI